MEEIVHDPKHPLDPIARIFDQIEHSAESSNKSESDTVTPESKHQDSDRLSTKPPQLTPKNNKIPALLLGPNLKVIWQNHQAITQVWHRASVSKNGSSTPHIFTLLMDADFQNKVENWRQWVSFFVRLAYRMLSKKELKQHIKLRNESEQDLLTSMMERPSSEELTDMHGAYMDQVVYNETTRSFRIAANEFKEGYYITFYPLAEGSATQNAKQRKVIKQQFEQIKLQQKPVKSAFSILTARLNKADIIQTELLSEEYSRLSNALMLKFHDTIEKFGAIFAQPDGNGLVAYFFPYQQEHKRMSMIECALDLKSQMGDMSREWKIRKGWLHDIDLNIALHYADEFIGTIPTALGDRLLVHGKALFECMQLCRMAADGQIWATKDFVGQMVPEEQKKLKFGIFRKDNHRQVLVNKSFSRLKDLHFDGIDPMDNHLNVGTLAVTQIFDRQIL